MFRPLGLLALVAACIAPSGLAGQERGSLGIALGPVWAADGDTLTDGVRHYHLVEIDAPELHQPCFLTDGRWWRCGVAAQQALGRAVAGRTVICGHAEGHHGMSQTAPLAATPDWAVRMCHTDDAGPDGDLARIMIADGWALAAAPQRSDLDGEQDAALGAARGIWQGSVERPELWRERW